MKPVKITREKFAHLQPGDIIQKRIEKRPTMFIEEGYEFTVISNDKSCKKVLVRRTVGEKVYQKNINYEGEGIESMMPNGESYVHTIIGSETTSYWLIRRAEMEFIQKFTKTMIIIGIVFVFLLIIYQYLKH